VIDVERRFILEMWFIGMAEFMVLRIMGISMLFLWDPVGSGISLAMRSF